MKRKLMSFIASTLVLVLLASCAGPAAPTGGDAPAAGNQPAQQPAQQQAADTPADADVDFGTTGLLPIVPEPITLTALAQTRPDITLGNDMSVMQELARRTNIHIEWQLLPIDAAELMTVFNVIMASGDIPDIVQHTNANNVNRFGMEGLFLPLRELILDYAPNMVAAFNNPLEGEIIPYDINVWGQITALDGEIYNVPIISSSNAIGAVWGIRTDWLEDLNMEVPTTADELHEVLRAFYTLGDDIIPFAATQGQHTERITPLVNAFDANMDLFIDGNQIRFGPIYPEWLEGITFINQLYEEGLIEEDYLTATNDMWRARAGGNRVGLGFMWPGSGFGVINNDLQTMDERFRFEPILPFYSPSGRRFKDIRTSGNAVMYRASISARTNYPVEIIRLFDYLFTEEGTTLAAFGIEGPHHTIVDGRPFYTDFVINNPDGLDPETARIREGMIWQLFPYMLGWENHFQANAVLAPWTIACWELYMHPGFVEAPLPILPFSETQVTRFNSLRAEIDTFREPMINRFIMGQEPLENHDAFVQGLFNAGLQELLDLMNEAFQLYLQQS